MKTLSLEHSRKALEFYDKIAPALTSFIKLTNDKDNVWQWLEADAACSKIVREAFYQDTKDRNQRDNCYRISVEDIRRFCESGKFV
jgi:hypothetical protein